MKKITHPIEAIVNEGNCVGCGFCVATYKKQTREKTTLTMEYDKKKDFIIPNVKNWNLEAGSGNFVCPGNKVNMPWLAKQTFGKLPEDYILGNYINLRVCYSVDDLIRKEAASGGLIPEILKYLFETKKINLAYVLHPGNNPYNAKGIIVKDAGKLSELHGSVYHPTNYGASLRQLINSEGTFAFVGLPCHIEGLEMYKAQDKNFAKRHYISLGLFCGGVNTFRGIEYYLNGFKIPWNDVLDIKYRVGNWPGSICVERKSKKSNTIVPRIKGNTKLRILRYVIGFQGYWMLKRCRLCPDQINDFADISVGDPHLKRFKEGESLGYSAVITRTEKGEKIIDHLVKANKVKAEYISRDEMIKTQGYTLDNRRHSLAYLRINKFFGGKNPDFKYYPQVVKNISFMHYIYAVVDLMKIYLPKNAFFRIFYFPWQIFEYLFITFTPRIIFERMLKLLKNK